MNCYATLIGEDARSWGWDDPAARTNGDIGTVRETVLFRTIDAVAFHITISELLSRNTLLNVRLSGRRSARASGGNFDIFVLSAVISI